MRESYLPGRLFYLQKDGGGDASPSHPITTNGSTAPSVEVFSAKKEVFKSSVRALLRKKILEDNSSSNQEDGKRKLEDETVIRRNLAPVFESETAKIKKRMGNLSKSGPQQMDEKIGGKLRATVKQCEIVLGLRQMFETDTTIARDVVLLNLIGRLPKELREGIIDRYVCKFKPEEIANKNHIGRNALTRRIKNGLFQLINLVDNYENPFPSSPAVTETEKTEDAPKSIAGFPRKNIRILTEAFRRNILSLLERDLQDILIDRYILNPTPTYQELCHKYGISEAELIQRENAAVAKLGSLISKDVNNNPFNTPSPTPEKQIAQALRQTTVTSRERLDAAGTTHKSYLRIDPENLKVAKKAEELGVLASLKDRLQYILRARYLADKLSTLQEIADHFNVSRAAINQSELRAVKKLKKLNAKAEASMEKT